MTMGVVLDLHSQCSVDSAYASGFSERHEILTWHLVGHIMTAISLLS